MMFGRLPSVWRLTAVDAAPEKCAPMPERFTKAERSAVMRAVKSTNTSPERRVRSFVHRLGFRFRLHRRDLPGTPDLVFPGRGKVIFVHGCFWHRHEGCSRATTPATNAEFWLAKLARNVARDAAQMKALKKLGWKVLVVWECQIRDEAKLASRLRRFLE